MASSTGNSSGTMTTAAAAAAMFLTSGSDHSDFRLLMAQRKRRRMESNRESARRSRMRKQLHMDELAATASQLTSKNARLASGIAVLSQQLTAVETENSILRAQLAELTCRLDSINGILSWVEPERSLGSVQWPNWLRNHRDWNSTCLNPPIVATAASHDMFPY